MTISRVEAWLDRVDASRPQLLWVHFIDPHVPDNCPAPFPQNYAGEVAFTDTLVGRLLQGWDNRLSADRSLAVITADHGEHLADHGVERDHGTLWITTLWIPLLLRCPETIPPASVVGELTRQIDVLPTLLDYCGLSMPYNVQGMSLRGMIEGEDSGMRLVHQGQAVHGDANMVTLRTEDYAFFFSDGNLAHSFDRRLDPGEEEDLCAPDDAIRQSVEHSLRDGKER